MNKLRTRINKWSLLCIAVFAAFYFFMFSSSALAGGNGWTAGATGANDYIYFRIDTEINVLNGKGVLIEWSCGGNGATSGSYNTVKGSVTDGTASDSDGLLVPDGIVQIASKSAENSGTNGSGCDVSEVVTATVSLGGWVTKVWNSVALTDTNFTTRASMDYTIRVNGVADELGNTLTLDGTTASATYDGTVASQSYSNYGGTWRKYIAGSTSGGYVTGGADGYVNRATTNTLTISATASTSVDFGATATTSLNDESGLLFGHKIQVYRSGGTFADNKITTGTVTAGNSYGTTCTMGTSTNAGYWYCPVPLANTGTSAKYSATSLFQEATVTYLDRSTGSNSQTVDAINPVSNVSGGGSYTPPPESTPATPATPAVPAIPATPEETPAVPATPAIPAVPATPTLLGFTNLAALNLSEGDTISASGSDDPDIYIANDWGYKRLFLNPVIFNFYGHLGGFANVKNTTSVTRDTLVTSGLFRNCEIDDTKVYGVETTGEDTGMLHWVNTSGSQAVQDDPEFFKKVFCINSNEFGWYPKGSDYTSVNQVPLYSR